MLPDLLSRSPHNVLNAARHSNSTLVEVLLCIAICPPGPSWDPDDRTTNAEGVSTDTPEPICMKNWKSPNVWGFFGPKEWANLIRSNAMVQNDQGQGTHTRAQSSGCPTHNS